MNAPPILRQEDGRFVPGVSANPSGRPKGAGLLRELFRGSVDEAVAVTRELLRDADPKVRQAAAAQIFDRVFGRAIQAIDSEVKKFDMNALYLAAVQLAQPAAPMVDVTPVPPEVPATDARKGNTETGMTDFAQRPSPGDALPEQGDPIGQPPTPCAPLAKPDIWDDAPEPAPATPAIDW